MDDDELPKPHDGMSPASFSVATSTGAGRWRVSISTVLTSRSDSKNAARHGRGTSNSLAHAFASRAGPCRRRRTVTCLMRAGGLLSVRSDGNPDYIARCAGERPAAYASYLIRAALRDDAIITPACVWDQLSYPTYQHHLIREARTTAGHYNIITSPLTSLELMVPPPEVQAPYVDSIRQIEGLAHRECDASRRADDLADSLVQRAFAGEL